MVVSLLLAEGFLIEAKGGGKKRGRGGSVSGFGVPWETMKIILIVGGVIIGVWIGGIIIFNICDAREDER